MIIDFHTHAFPDFLAVKAIPVLEEKCSSKAFTDGTVKQLTESLDRAGVDMAVVNSIATKPTQETSVNNFAISLLENKRLVPFGSVFPGSDTAISELERIKAAGLRGVKLHPEYQQFYLDCEAAFPIYEKCAQLGLVITFHAGADAGYPPPVHALPDRINRVTQMFPDTVFVAAHFGGYNTWDRVESELVPRDNLYLDTSMTDTIAKLSPDTAKKIISHHGTEHILLGSDLPWERQETSIAKIRSYGLSARDTELILGENAKRLLKL